MNDYMDILLALGNLAIFAMIVTISTDNVEDILKPYFSITKYKLTVALVLTSVGVIALNVGIMGSIGIITESALSWIHYVDLVLSILVLTTGAQSIHRLAETIVNFFAKRTSGQKGE